MVLFFREKKRWTLIDIICHTISHQLKKYLNQIGRIPDSEIMYLYIFASSATSNINDWINTVVTSLYIKNKRGEIWSSWGTPEETGMEPDKKLPHLINWNLFRKNENNQERRGSWISYLRSFKINKLWLISSIYGISNILAIFRQRL